YATHLGIAVAVLLTQLHHAIALLAGRFQEIIGTVFSVNADRRDRQPFVLLARDVVRGPAMIADDTQHRLTIRGVTRERTDIGSDFRRGGVGGRVHEGGQGAALSAALGRIVGQALYHEQGAHVGVAEAERAEVVGLLGDADAGELRHVDGDFQDQ